MNMFPATPFSRVLVVLAAALLVVAVPLFLVTASVAWAVNDAGLYRQGFQRYSISAVTRISDPDLVRVGSEIRRYFNSREEPLAVQARVGGMERDLFNDREVRHMADVKRLIWGVYAAAAVSGAYLLAITFGGSAWKPGRYGAAVARLYLSGGVLTLALLLLVGLLALTGFEGLFLAFHRISFSNDLWQLNQNTDFLLMMFPQAFWFDATMRVAGGAVIGAVAAIVLPGGYLLYRRWNIKREAAAPVGRQNGVGR
jgi:integral membrane protein (TIGR01906 family)